MRRCYRLVPVDPRGQLRFTAGSVREMANSRPLQQAASHRVVRRRTSSIFVLPRRYAAFRLGLVPEWFFLLYQPVSAKRRESMLETRAAAVVFSAVFQLGSAPDRQPGVASEAPAESRACSS